VSLTACAAVSDAQEDVKPEGHDDIPARLADPEAEKPDDWDDEDDGEWEAPMIDNPEFKGEWKAKMIDNPVRQRCL
jgi:calreticulin